MSFFHSTKKQTGAAATANANTDTKPSAKLSVRDLQARAYEKWLSQGVAEKQSHAHGFEQARVARRASQDQEHTVDMRY